MISCARRGCWWRPVADLFPPTIDEQIACVERELGYRGHVYRRRVGSGQMTQAKADKEIAAMQAVLATLKRVKETGL
jgi:hypothetical protein